MEPVCLDCLRFRTELERVKLGRDAAIKQEINHRQAYHKDQKTIKQLREALEVLRNDPEIPLWAKNLIKETLSAGKGEPTDNDQLPVYTPNGFV